MLQQHTVIGKLQVRAKPYVLREQTSLARSGSNKLLYAATAAEKISSPRLMAAHTMYVKTCKQGSSTATDNHTLLPRLPFFFNELPQCCRAAQCCARAVGAGEAHLPPFLPSPMAKRQNGQATYPYQHTAPTCGIL